MRSHSTLARLQQLTTFSLLACAALWMMWHWRESPPLAAAGFLAIVMGYSLFLAIEFIALRCVDRGDPATRPTWAALTRAWLSETAAAPRVFCWRQPFRWRAIADLLDPPAGPPGRRGAVFVHGFVCNRGFWNPWMARLRALGHPFVAVNLEPVFGSIDAYVPIIEDAVQRVTRASGLAPVLVCHSMGGLAARAWLRATPAPGRVHHIITIGSPHHGTWLARFSLQENGRQMRRGGNWVGGLEQDGDPARHALFTCWYSDCDNVVFPASSATLHGADNRLVRGVPHVALAFHRRVMDDSLAKITGMD